MVSVDPTDRSYLTKLRIMSEGVPLLLKGKLHKIEILAIMRKLKTASLKSVLMTKFFFKKYFDSQLKNSKLILDNMTSSRFLPSWLRHHTGAYFWKYLFSGNILLYVHATFLKISYANLKKKLLLHLISVLK